MMKFVHRLGGGYLGTWVADEANDPRYPRTVTHYVYRTPDGKLRTVSKHSAVTSHRAG